MIWLAWRQHRRQLLFTVIGLAVLAALMIPTGLAMRHAFTTKGIAACARAGLGPDGDETCQTALQQFDDQFGTLRFVGVLFLFLPLLVGLFWGAPVIAREVEHGTHRLVWTQGVSRRRWALVKFGLVGTATLLVATVFGLGMSWWLMPLNQIGDPGRFDYLFFDMQGVVPIGYTLFAVALGICAGALWPRMLPAMAVTLVGFLGLRIALTALARPHYLAASVRTFLITGSESQMNVSPSDWVLETGVRDASGKMVAANTIVSCRPPPDAPPPDPSRVCGSRLGLGPGAYNWMLYQPAGRFWTFQFIETGIFVALAALLLYVAARRIRRIA